MLGGTFVSTFENKQLRSYGAYHCNRTPDRSGRTIELGDICAVF
jgi:hypothetical protein